MNKKQFKFSSNSLNKLEKVNKNLQDVMKLAITLSSQDFMIVEGLRTLERQIEMRKKGLTQTLKSAHLTGNAVDIVAVVDGKPSWDWQYFYPIAEAVREAAKKLGVRIRWGGAWVVLNDTSKPIMDLVRDYKLARRAEGKRPFLDGVHFEVAE